MTLLWHYYIEGFPKGLCSYAFIIGWILVCGEQRNRERNRVHWWDGGLLWECRIGKETDNVSARNPFVTILSWGCVLKCFTSVIADTFFLCRTIFKISTFNQLTAQTCCFVRHYGLCGNVSHAAELKHNQNTLTKHYDVRVVHMYSFACLQSSLYAREVVLTWPICAGCCNGPSLVDKLLSWGSKWERLISAHLFCVEEKGHFKFHWRFIKCNATCHILFLIKRLQCLHQMHL